MALMESWVMIGDGSLFRLLSNHMIHDTLVVQD